MLFPRALVPSRPRSTRLPTAIPPLDHGAWRGRPLTARSALRTACMQPPQPSLALRRRIAPRSLGCLSTHPQVGNSGPWGCGRPRRACRFTLRSRQWPTLRLTTLGRTRLLGSTRLSPRHLARTSAARLGPNRPPRHFTKATCRSRGSPGASLSLLNLTKARRPFLKPWITSTPRLGGTTTLGCMGEPSGRGRRPTLSMPSLLPAAELGRL